MREHPCQFALYGQAILHLIWLIMLVFEDGRKGMNRCVFCAHEEGSFLLKISIRSNLRRISAYS